MHTNASVVTVMAVQLSKKFIEIILVGNPVVLPKNRFIEATLREKLLTFLKIINEHMNPVADLVAGIGSQTIAVIFKLDFDVVGAALLTSAQALHMNRHSVWTCV